MYLWVLFLLGLSRGSMRSWWSRAKEFVKGKVFDEMWT